MPGEKLLTKLWETLADKGIGSLLKPWHVGRMRKVELEAKYKDIIMTADAEKKAEDIKNGKIAILDNKELSFRNIDEIDTHIESSRKVENIKKEVNVSNAILYAEKELENDVTEPSKEEIDEDWLYKWKNNASEVSKEELQRMWGRLLVGELKSPGKYSLRTMDFLKHLSQEEALLLENVGQFIIRNSIIYEEEEKSILNQYNLPFQKLLELQELGILSGVDSLGLSVGYSSLTKDSYQRTLPSHDKALLISHKDCNKKISLTVIRITKLGEQIFDLGVYAANEEYLYSIGKRLIQNEYKVKLADVQYIDKDTIKILTSKEIQI